MFVWLLQFSASVSASALASAAIKIVVVRFVDADAEFFGDRREDAAFRRRRSTGVNETNKSLLKKLTPTQPQVAASTKRIALNNM